MAREFCGKLPKVELHAHLNGSLSVSTINKLHKLHQHSFPNEEVPNVSDITIDPKVPFIYYVSTCSTAPLPM